MANTVYEDSYYAYAIVDSDPDSGTVFGTRAVNFRSESTGVRVGGWFSTDGQSTVTLQFKRPVDDDWVDYNTYSASTREKLEESGAGVKWCAVIKSGDFVSECRFGFDW